MKKIMDGNEAAAYVSYNFTEVAGIYPITPASPMAEFTDKWSSEGKLWNKPSAGESYGGRTVSNAWIVTNKQNKKAQAPVK